MKLRAAISLAAALSATALVALTDDFATTLLARVVVMVVIVLSAMIALVATRRDRRLPWLCDPVVLVMAILAQFYVVGPIVLAVQGFNDMPFMHAFAPEQSLRALAGCILLLAFFAIGYHMRLGDVIADRLPEFRPGPRRLPGHVADLLFVGGGVIGCIGWTWWQGGLTARLSSGYADWKQGGAIFTIVHVVFLVGILLMSWRVYNAPHRTRWTWAPLAGVLAFALVFYGVIYGVRKYLFYIFFGMLAVWLLRHGSSKLPKARVAIAAALLLVFFSVWGTIRARPLGDILSGAEDPRARTQPFYQGYFHGVSEPFAVACMVYQVFPEEEAYRLGDTLLVTVLGFIPRALWPGKPVGIGKELTKYFVGPFYEPVYGFSVAPTIPADFYLNFSWFGIAVGGFLLGLVCRTMTRYSTVGMIGNLQTSFPRVVIPAVFLMQLGELRGDMSTILAFYVLAYLPLVIALSLFRFDGAERAVVSPSGFAFPPAAPTAR